MADSGEIGVWFTTHPTAVISTYLTDDPTPVPMDHADLENPDTWLEYADKIDFCVVTLSDHAQNPGINQVEDVCRELSEQGVDVYIAITALLGRASSPYDMMVDGEGIRSRHWIRPTDQKRVDHLRDEIDRYCSRIDPSGVLLWYATFPNENYCYESGCVDEATRELDLEERSTVLAEFLESLTSGIREDHPDIDIALEVDIQGAANIEYHYGIDLEKVAPVVDQVFLHVRDGSDETVTRAVQIASEAASQGIEPKFYLSLLYEQNFRKIYDPLVERFPTDVLVYSPRASTVDQVLATFISEKWEDTVERGMLAGSLVSVLVGGGEVLFGWTLPLGSFGVPMSIVIGLVLFLLSYRQEQLPFVSQTIVATVSRRRS